jgi:hypothetical protein
VRVYFDSSVVLRVVLGERGRLAEWSRTREAVTSEITRVEGVVTGKLPLWPNALGTSRNHT